MWSHPAEGPAGESYYAVRLGDVFLISLNVSRIWRTWNVGERDRGKFTEPLADLDNPENWGFGEFLFERFDRHSEQYRWLRGVLRSKAFKESRYKVVMAHQTAFGLGDNAAPVLTDPVMQVTRDLGNGRTHTLTLRQPIRPRTWELLVERHLGSIVEVSYAYPLTRDIWKRDVEPLLRRHGVQLVLVGHSHLWNRTRVSELNYLESSNVGNSFGAYYEDELGPWRDAGRASRARSFWSELETPESRWDPKDYPPRNDPHGRAPIFPATSNPMQTMEGEARPLPFVSSNNVTVFSILDTAEGAVRSFAFDTRDPESEVVEFDRFELKSGRSRRAPY